MTDYREYDEHPELLLAGADRPRPLSPALRGRLEDALVAASSTPGEPARALSAEVRDRLETSLRPARGPGKAPRTGLPARWAGWRAITATAAAAAVIVVLAALVVPGLARGPHSQPTAAPSSPKTHPVMGPSGAVVRAKAPGHNSPAQPVQTSRLYAPQNRAPLPKSTGTPGQPSTVVPQAANAAQVAEVTAVNPERGPARGGNWVVVRGQGLTGAQAVYFGTVPAMDVSSISARELKARAPAHAPGTVQVIVVARTRRSVAVSPGADRYSFIASAGSNAPAAHAAGSS